MSKARKSTAAAAIVAMSVAMLPQAGEAAWWKFGRDKAPLGADDRNPLVQQAQVEPSDRMNRIENTLRNLTGQIEQLTFQLRQLQDQVKRAQDDNEFRFQELEGGKAGKKAAAASPPAADADEPPQAAAEAAPAPVAEAPPVETLTDTPPVAVDPGGATLGAPPKSLGTLVLDEAPPAAADQPIDLSAIAQGGQPAERQTAALAPTGDPRTDYEAAYGGIRNGDYALAEAGFRQFLAAHPGDRLAPDAQYWLGESFFARGQFREAADQFLAGYKAYPKSDKGPDTLLKLGLSLAGLGERDAACSTYTKVLKQYPQVSNAMRQRIRVEQDSARC